MAFAHFTPLFLGLLSALQPFAMGSCSLPGEASLEAAINKLLDALPEEQENPYMAHSLLPGLSLEGMTVRGFDKIERYGPIQTLCEEAVSESGETASQSIAQADFVINGIFEVSFPWKTCDGSSGAVNVHAGLSRFTLQFRVETSHPDHRDALKLTVRRDLRPVALEDIRLSLTGGGSFLRKAGSVVGKLFNTQLRDVLLKIMDWQILMVFKEYAAVATNEVDY